MVLTQEDRQLIEEEENILRTTLESLCRQLPQVQASKISANQAARELTAQVVNEWNHEERQPLISDEAVAHRVLDIRKNSDKALYALIQEPYFGRVITREEDGSEVSFLIGKTSNIEAGVVDWRNGPIAGLYFNYKQDEEFFEVINQRERSGQIKLRRAYRIENGQLVQIDCPEGVFRRAETKWEKLDVEDEVAAHRSRASRSKEKSLPNILSLITKEQFEMITSDPEIPVIIQGSAGSGKTTVALHRLAWLLHEENSQALAKNTRVMVMNKSLQIYVSATLPSMSIQDVQTSTFNSWALSVIGKVVRGRPFFKFHNVPSFVEEIKFSDEILKALEGWVEKQNKVLVENVEKEFKKWPGLLKTWKKYEDKALLPRLRDFTHDVKESSMPKYDKDQRMLFLERTLFDLEDYVQDIYNLLSDSEHLKTYLSADAKLDSNLDYLKRLTERNRAKNNLDYFDMSLVLRLIQLKNDGIPDGSGGVVALDHLVIDEAQDFGPVEFAIMMASVSDKRQITIVGDVAQKILSARKFIGWNKVVSQLGLEEDSIIRLEVSFRCTVPIMTLAHKVAGEPKKVEGRAGSEPEWYKAEDRDSMLEHLVTWSNRLIKANPYALIALICRYPKQAMELKEELEQYLSGEVRLGHRDQFSFEPGIMVTNIHQVKGLEFDSVALIEPDEDNYPIKKEESRNMIYVGITRAQDELLLTSVKAFSRVFFY
ncbi:MAG: UvrD-helicase domain-containing protein [Nitrospinaceae bacterium]|nr:UvrD-helicase domain-containing protein [Nitrospina sp.]MBT5377332.1 UvrD-helicase domain-containing protein [Nitrospinaceae bacterium]MBT5867639.1 UvrD-helicase domain-containing protein [Nitrospinaceae bacterium]MBT6347414.1 UvrD-helicase domain-containing protein [Nitrospina sp.]